MNGDDEYDLVSALAHQQELDWQELLSLDPAYFAWLSQLEQEQENERQTKRCNELR